MNSNRKLMKAVGLAIVMSALCSTVFAGNVNARSRVRDEMFRVPWGLSVYSLLTQLRVPWGISPDSQIGQNRVIWGISPDSQIGQNRVIWGISPDSQIGQNRVIWGVSVTPQY